MTNKDKLLDEVYQYRKSIVLLSAAKEGLFDILVGKDWLTLEEITAQLNWDKRGGEIVLNSLCSQGYLNKKDGQFKISSLYQEVFSPENYELVKEWLLHEWRLLNRWVHLPEVLESGKPFREPEKKSIHRNHTNFILSMAQREKVNLETMVNAVSLDGYRHLLDLGGGPGLFAIGFAEKYPALKATVFDSPETGPIAKQYFEESSVTHKLHFKAGNFLEDHLGDGYDAALLSSILHIYSPEENRKLLKKVYHSMQPNGKVIIRDFFLNRKRTGPIIGTLFAINMLVNTERGNAYATEEMKAWLKEAGFRKIRKRRLQSRMAILEAVKSG